MSDTNPLGRAVTTAEGVATLVLGAAVSALSAIDPSTLPHSLAAVVAGGLSVALLAQRMVIKVSAIKALGVDPVKYLEHELLGEAEAAPVAPDLTPNRSGPAPVLPVVVTPGA